MKKYKKLFLVLILTVSFVLISIIIYFIIEQYSLKKSEYLNALEKIQVYNNLLISKKAYLQDIQANEQEYKNYYELWKNETLVASNKNAWTSVISRIAADKDVLLRHLDEFEHDSQKVELEITGKFESLLDWMNSCENHLYNFKILKSRWIKETEDTMKLLLEIKMYNPEIIES